MKIRVKALTAEVEIDLPDEEKVLSYNSTKITTIIDEAKKSVIEIETKLRELSNPPANA